MARTRSTRNQSNRKRSGGGKTERTGVLLGIAGAAVMMLLVYQVFLRSDDATPKSLGPVPAQSATKGASAGTTPQEPTLPNGSFAELSLRDPFEAPTRFTPGGGSTTTTTQPTTTTTDSSQLPTTPTTSPAQNPAPTTDVALLDVFADTAAGGAQTARIRVGTVEYTAVAGQTFATNYKVISFTTCVGGQAGVNLTYADSPFSLCQGEQVTK